MHRPRRRTTGSTALIGLTLGALGAGLLAAAPANAAVPAATGCEARGRRGPGRAGCHVALRPGPQGLPGHRAEPHVEGLVHGRGRRPVGRLLPDRSTTPTSRRCSTSSPTARRSPTCRPATRRTPCSALDRPAWRAGSTSTAKSGRYTLVTDYLTDPARDSVVMRTTLLPGEPPGPARRSTSGSTARSTATAAAATRRRRTAAPTPPSSTPRPEHPVPVSIDTKTATIAANRDYAQPVYAALRADRPFPRASSGFAGTAERRPGPARRRPRAWRTTYATATQRQRRPDRAGRRPARHALPAGAGLRLHAERRGRRPPGAAPSAAFAPALPRLPQGLGGVRPRPHARRRSAAGPDAERSARSCAAPTCCPRTCSRPARTRRSRAPSVAGPRQPLGAGGARPATRR